MTTRLDDIMIIAAWPLYLSRDEAAKFVGVSPGTFDREVAAGRWPEPIHRGRRLTWYRPDLEKAGARQDSTFNTGEDNGQQDTFERFRSRFAARRKGR